MTLKIQQQGDVLHFTGVLNRDTLMQYSPFTLLNNASTAVTFDFAALENIDTAGLAWLLHQLSKAKEKGTSIVLSNVPKQLLSLADVTAVRPLLPISD
ncbi:STAS domain-containing protein [Rheinheimera baltica]|uniref:STAS domain-containing protein n=1 Tax=Rheinheimera baltica TaxID=67576 RepID=A0ABT9HZW8_9GAMM|nr:STAS domain-containing protein [Rheinheimera baltica]MDP5136656.1 STAS domain-containing protein [Rheinheimera baltica]MDP5142490.1 STAS domain-containing protein [Rheinheimera baltica]MDP5150363.1 STAS domain-containing protein [Rheinheimera baltica]MDP5188660.1 STAS domain-containing protein [Rheinheimera baltica]